METRNIANEILQNLFDGYVEHGGTSIYSINDVTDRYNMNAHEMGKYLIQHGWIKDQRFLPTSFDCAISEAGINHIAPNYFTGLIDEVSITAGLTNDWTDVLDSISSFKPKDFQIAFDVGRIMQQRGLAEVQNTGTGVFIKLTLLGKERYNDRNKGNFF